MNGITKFAIGGGATALMAMASHSALGLGQAYVDRLTAQANTALAAQQMGAGIAAAAATRPALERVIILSGKASEADRARLEAVIKAIPGVRDARWSADPAAEAVTSEASLPPATAVTVNDCQADVDAAINGRTIQFDSGAASISAESVPLIDALAAALGPCGGTSVAIAGHTDATGQPAANQALSETRAKAVAAELINRGIPAGRLVPNGYGAAKPLQPGTSAAANAVNRRIEFLVASAAASATE